MTNAFTLDDLNNALVTKYAPFVFSAGKAKYTLKQVLALPKEKREVVKSQLKVLEDTKNELEEEEILAILKAVIQNVCDDDVDKLFNLLDNDLVRVSILVEQWVGVTQAGEA